MIRKVSVRHASLACSRLQNRTSLKHMSFGQKEVSIDGFDRSFCFMSFGLDMTCSEAGHRPVWSYVLRSSYVRCRYRRVALVLYGVPIKLCPSFMHTIIHWQHSNIQLKHTNLHLQHSCQAFKIHSQHSNIAPNIQSIEWNIQSRHANFTYNIWTCSLNMRLFNSNSHFGHSTFNSTFHSNIRLVNWDMQSEHSIGTFNWNIQFEHSIRTFNPNIQFEPHWITNGSQGHPPTSGTFRTRKAGKKGVRSRGCTCGLRNFFSVLMLNKKDRPNTTPTVRAMCTFAV